MLALQRLDQPQADGRIIGVADDDVDPHRTAALSPGADAGRPHPPAARSHSAIALPPLLPAGDGALLIDLWDEPVLSSQLRAAWQPVRTPRPMRLMADHALTALQQAVLEMFFGRWESDGFILAGSAALVLGAGHVQHDSRVTASRRSSMTRWV